MEPASDRTDLRNALTELRLSYHRALARKLGRRTPPESDLRDLIANERDEGRIAALISARSRSPLRWTGIWRFQRWVSQFSNRD
jgi:hypothetical protein